jgi:hypothetical protein
MDPRALVNKEIKVIQDFFVVFPLMQCSQIVTPHDQCKLIPGVFFSEIYQGVNSVRWFRETKLDIGCPDFDILANSQGYHMQSIKVISESRFLF